MVLPAHAELPHHLVAYMEISDTEDVCVVCQDPPSDPVQTTCEHVYCRECLETWCDGHNTCPSCRTTLYTYATIPARRLITIPEGFFDLLDFAVYDQEEVEHQLELYDGLSKLGDDFEPVDDDDEIEMKYNEDMQATLVGVGIWFINKVDDDYEPHLREVFKKDWIKVIHALHGELRQHDEWTGRASIVRQRLEEAVMPSTEEPRRAPAHVDSWNSLEEGEAWYREHGHRWVGDGWREHADRIRKLLVYVLISQWLSSGHNLSDSDDEHGSDGEGEGDDNGEGDHKGGGDEKAHGDDKCDGE